MTLDEIARNLVEEHGGRPGELFRRVHPESACDLWVCAASTVPRLRVELWALGNALADLDEPRGTKGIGARMLRPPGTEEGRLVLELHDDSARDLFVQVAGDVASAAARQEDPERGARAWAGRFERWQRLLRGDRQGLSGEAQRGLYGELLTMREMLSSAAGWEAAVAAWTGPAGSPHDFELAGLGVEAKATASNNPQNLRINGERQLDDSDLEALFLVHHSLEVHRDAGETLPAAVAAVRGHVSGGPAEGAFEDRLLEAGYVDMHEGLYAHTGYGLRDRFAYRVVDGFPRLIESTVPEGIGGVAYSVSLSACGDYRIDPVELQDALRRSA